MDMPKLTPAIATIAATLTAGGVAYFASILSKEQKTSEFRQTWIDALREDISEYIGTAEVVLAVLRAMALQGEPPDEMLDYLVKNESALRELMGTYYRVRLRLNLEKHDDLLTALDALYASFNGQQYVNVAATDSLIKDIDTITHRVLKREWRRVKRGEKTFYISKYISLAVLLGAGGFLTCLLLGHIALFWVP
jgi:hypothetical protein